MPTLVKWTIEDYHNMIDAGILAQKKVELIAGEIVEMTPEKPVHRRVTFKLADYFREKLRGKAIIFEAHPITLFYSEPEPDIIITKLPLERYDTRHPYPEDIDLLIEVSDSTLKYDLETKQKIYALARIKEYWIIDIKNSQLIVFQQPENDCYVKQIKLTKGVISPLAFSNLKIDSQTILN
ncbi:Uma2 family endonuclease [Crocosphaera sp.]|uniref:Uma2 family endonuclease n=1 Tax=Crocosphaera sp. TaxID=2729996 RepID=UPI003F29019A|nr:Uma2 family endonuclease [Crocosphaera sp.]